MHLPIQQIWYVRQRGPKRFMMDYFDYRNEGLDKFDDDFLIKRQQSFAEKRAYIQNTRQLAGQYNWKIVDMDYQPHITEKFIIQTLQNIA